MEMDRSRRAFLGMEPPSHREECHISSLLVHVRPERQDEIAARIASLPGAELAPSPMPGKLVVTLETPTTFEIVDHLRAIHDLPGVVSACLVYHQWEAAGNEDDDGSYAPQLSQG